MRIRVFVIFALLVIALTIVYGSAAEQNDSQLERQAQAQDWEYVQIVYWFDSQRISIYAADSTLFNVAPIVEESGANVLMGDNGLMEYMNLLGANGWELVSTSEHYSEELIPDGLSLFFKRLNQRQNQE